MGSTNECASTRLEVAFLFDLVGAGGRQMLQALPTQNKAAVEERVQVRGQGGGRVAPRSRVGQGALTPIVPAKNQRPYCSFRVREKEIDNPSVS